MDKQAQDKRWQALTDDGRQSRIASYQELLKLQKEEADSYLITIEDLEKLYGKHNLQPKPLTYEDVARELFKQHKIDSRILNTDASYKQAEKLLAINKLLNVAKFLNKDWKPDWKNGDEQKWAFNLNHKGGIVVIFCQDYNSHIVYFRTEELAKQAVQILGEDTVRLALTTEY